MQQSQGNIAIRHVDSLASTRAGPRDALHLTDLLLQLCQLLRINRHNCKMSDLRLRHAILPCPLVSPLTDTKWPALQSLAMPANRVHVEGSHRLAVTFRCTN